MTRQAFNSEGNSVDLVRTLVVIGRKYRKKPVVIEAFRTTQELTIKTLEGDHLAQPGDWIIRGIKGEFYPCKPDIFEQTYEEVDAW